MTITAPDLSTLRGDQRPRILTAPPRVSSAGTEATDLARLAGLQLDPWQCLMLEEALGESADGKWSSFEVGLVVSRQNGKGSILEARELAGLFLFNERLILHSAHEFKALDVATPILTSTGWSTMGELADGDEVFAPDGTPTKVVAAHPVRHDRPCYRLRLDDGQEVLADAEHLWGVEEVEGSHRVSRVLTTQQMVERGVSTVAKRTGRDRRTYRFRVAIPAPLSGPDTDLPVDPWLLGAWLGDGTSAKGELTVGLEELPYITGRLDALGETYRIREDKRTQGRVLTVIIEGLRARLKAAGVLGNKRIPSCYFTASERQRRDLLAGVMDTDGTVSTHQLAVTMVKRELMEDVASLVRSLGYKASLREFRASIDGRDAGPMWRVQLSASQDVSPFQMPRKAAKVTSRQARVTRSQYNAIVAIEPVESRPTRCITVAHESSMYLVGRGFVPTHNTAQESFLRLRELIEGTPDFSRRVKRITNNTFEVGIELTTGQRIRFVARSRGSGRGFSGDLVVLDEAYNLPEETIDALMPTLSARPSPQLWYTTSAPDKNIAPCIPLARLRRRGLSANPGSLTYLEWSIDPHTDLCRVGCEIHDEPHDPRSWAKANPAMGIRISATHVSREMDSMSAEGFLRERLGVGTYPSESADQWAVIPEDVFTGLLDAESTAVGRVAFAVDVSPNGASAAISMFGLREDGLGHGEVIDHHPGAGWAVDRLVQLNTDWNPVAIVVDPGGPAGAIIAALEARGVTVTKLTARDVAAATGSLITATGLNDGDEATLRLIPHPGLAAAVAGAETSPLSDAVKWNRKAATIDIPPLVSVTLARFGFMTATATEEPTPQFWNWAEL